MTKPKRDFSQKEKMMMENDGMVTSQAEQYDQLRKRAVQIGKDVLQIYDNLHVEHDYIVHVDDDTMIDIEDTFDHDIAELERIQRVLLENGFTASLHQCERIYVAYSDSYAASWLNLPPTGNHGDDELWKRISSYHV